MSEEQVSAAAATTTTETAAPSVLGFSDQPVVSKDESILDVAGAQDKQAQESENKRLREADPTTLKAEDVNKRDALLKADEAAKQKALAEEKAKGVPEKYEIKAPEGVTLDQVVMDKVLPKFKELGFTNNQAQAMVDMHNNLVKEQTEKSTKQFNEFLETSAKETMEALNSEGRSAKTELAYVAKIKNYFSPESLDLLTKSGMGNQKSFIMDLAKIGRMFSEEKNVDTGKGSAATKDIAELFYPNMKK